MFSKIKSIFSDRNNPETESPSFKHPKLQEGDISQCPFMNKTKEKQTTSDIKKD